MKTVTLNIKNYRNIMPLIKIDGKRLRFKKASNGDMTATYTTELPQAALTIDKYYEMGQRLWWLYAFALWVVGVFGIFTAGYDKRCPSIKFQTNIDTVEDVQVNISFFPFADGATACAIHSPQLGGLSNQSNHYFVNKRAEKNAKVYRILGTLASIFTILGGGVFLGMKLLGF